MPDVVDVMADVADVVVKEPISPAWKAREQARFDDGTYRPIPALPGLERVTWVPDHYVHLSVKGEVDMIAYTPNEQKGAADRQVSMKFGRYLKQFYSLDDTTIHAAVVALRAALTGDAGTGADVARLQLATDRDTISRIFETEMSACNSTYASCMHGKFADWTHPPYHVYADSPDVGVAYMEVEGGIVARSVVSTKTKHWVRLYAVDGCETRCEQLKGLLLAAGYSYGDLEGSRLTRLPREGRKEILPYLDGSAQAVDSYDHRYWIVVTSGEYECTNTDGYGEPQGERCPACEEPIDDCECLYCECCEERYPDGCPRCSICEQCEGCIQHGGCSCDRCEDCGELINPRRRYVQSCECDRCSECGNLAHCCECPNEDESEDESEDGRMDTDNLTASTAYLFVRTEGGEYRRVPVVASIQFADHTFLIHRSLSSGRAQFTVTYAPLGLSAGSGDTAQEAVNQLLARDADRVRAAVDSAIANALTDHLPMLGAEEGIHVQSI